MAKTTTDSRRVLIRTFLEQLADKSAYDGTADAKPASTSELDNILESIDSELSPLLRMDASSPIDLTVTIGNAIITNPESSRNRSIPYVGSSVPNDFSSGTVVFPSTSGGTITVTPGTNGTLTVTNNNYIKVLIYLDSNGDLNVASGTEGASEAAATLPSSVADTYAIGYVTLFNNAGTIDNISQSNIYQFDSAGSYKQTSESTENVDSDTNYYADYNCLDSSNVTVYDDNNPTPIDGTGGSPASTVTNETTDPIFGNTSYNLLKNSTGFVSRQGEGWSFPMSNIDNGAYGKPIKVEFTYKTVGPSYDDGDVTVWVYKDDTGLQPLNSYDSLGNFSNKLKKDESKGGTTFSSSFTLGKDDTEARVLFHVNSTDTFNYNIIVDHMFIGHKSSLSSPIISNSPDSYTPTYSASLGTVTHDFADYWQIGNFIHIRGRFTTGTVTSGVATISLPSNLSIKSSNNHSAGQWHAGVTSTSDFSRGSFKIVNGDTFITMVDDFSTAASSGTAFSAANANVILSSSTVYNYELTIPITEWEDSSNIFNSTQQIFHTPSGRFFRTSSQQSIAHATNVDVAFNSTSFNNKLDFNSSTGEITVPTDGVYLVYTNLEYAAFNSSATLYARIKVNGSYITDGKTIAEGINASWNVDACSILDLKAGDIITIGAQQNTGVAQNIQNLTRSSYVAVCKLPNLEIIGNAGVPDEYIKVGLGNSSSTTTADTWTDGYSSSFDIMLTPGTWEIGYDLQMYLYKAGAGSNTTYVGNVRIYNTTDSAPVDDSVSFGSTYLGVAGTIGNTYPTRRVVRVEITEDKTYRLQIRNGASNTNGATQIIGGSFTGLLTEPDAESFWFAKRIK